MKIINVVGARPNFVKIAPIMYEMKKSRYIKPVLVHTGQHYDEKMSKLFFDHLGIPKPDIDLEVGSSSHAVQTAQVMKKFEPILLEMKPDYVLVVGDVNSTIACALTASKLGIKIIHVEAGLRSFDRSMPEEINRVLTDAISDVLFTTEKSANKNLVNEGIAREKIYFVGNVMIDSLLKHKKKAQKSEILTRLGLVNSGKKKKEIMPYAVLTLHRPGNVDNREKLAEIFEALAVIGKELPIIFPVHPRTRKKIEEFKFNNLKWLNWNGLNDGISAEGISMVEPMGYLDFLNLMANSKLVLTDSGGIQEETTVLKVPCLTLRHNTERPVTIEKGTNRIVGTDKKKILEEGLKVLQGDRCIDNHPELWDGKAAKRIVDTILKDFG